MSFEEEHVLTAITACGRGGGGGEREGEEETGRKRQAGEREGGQVVSKECHNANHNTKPPPPMSMSLVLCHSPHMCSFLGRCFDVMTCRVGTTCWMLTVWEVGL